jgi:hypothetical protein
MSYREYEYHLPDGTEAAIAVTLCGSSGPGADLAHQLGAVSHGMIAVVGVPGIQPKPLVWIRTEDGLSVLMGRDDPPLGDDLGKTIARVLTIFFRDLGDVSERARPHTTRNAAVRPSGAGISPHT